MKILTVVGARPQFIKAGSVSRVIKKYGGIKEIILHTGQHYDYNMSSIFFDEMGISKPNYFLGIGGNTHGAMTGQMIERIEEIAIKEKPDWMIVYGDTNSTLAGALVASKLQIKLAHIEAGIRSFSMKMPEEINRILTDRVSNLLFCPTDTAVNNLSKEGFDNFDCSIIKSGDVMYDGVLFYKKYAKRPNVSIDSNFILCTIHRAENTDEEFRLRSIFDALIEIANDTKIILPLHPRTRKMVESLKVDISKINILDPVGYFEMMWFIDNCSCVITDSGGLQKEAYFLGKPCLTMRDETEWVELVEIGANILVGADKDKILNAFYCQKFADLRKINLNLYGNGYASEIVVETLIK
ncbi:non-hydrolyzing UDP-N-acetylglucosamine 2-epimerase [Campylobacter sp. MOP51]|uniref:non-hydrolyzing UDP-N-acetylglucosamine 2-epimerase n=1 Tax=Campylobacter canis TaxID=3378588 RepID=UPI003C607099